MVNLLQSFFARISGSSFRTPLIKNLTARKHLPNMAGKESPLVWIDCEVSLVCKNILYFCIWSKNYAHNTHTEY